MQSRYARRILLALLTVLPLALGAPLQAAEPAARKPFTPDDLVRLARLSDPEVSPDGRYVAYVLRETDIDANRGRTDLWLLDLEDATRTARRLTQNPANDFSPRWAADGRGLFFLSTRSGSSQVWYIDLTGGEAQAVTELPLEVGSFKVAPRGDRIALSLEVFPDCADLKCSADRIAARGKEKASGKTFDQLFVRHWDTWVDGTISTLFSAPLVRSVDKGLHAGAVANISGKIVGHVPSKPNGGDEDYTFSPDGTQLVWSARLADRSESWSTNFDLYSAPADGSGTPTNLTRDNPAWDAQPVFLANGDLAWLAMTRPGFEADRFGIKIRDAASGKIRDLATDWDRSVGHLATTFDGKRLLASADDIGQVALFEIDPVSGRRTRVVGRGQVAEFTPARKGIVIAWASLGGPADLFLATREDREPQRLTSVNRRILDERALGDYEQFSFAGADGATVYGYVVKPYGYTAGKKFPIAFLVHGGPQVSFQNQWSWRWNAQTFAGAGYGVVFIDFHGSPGYGQKFTDSISGDWGGKPFVDLQKGLEAAITKFDFLDGSRACSLGASYGGFMQTWIAGNWPERFKCIVNHAGIFDQRTMYYTTEELWFTEWENGGPYFNVPANHEKFNPAAYVAKWRTPMLVTHGGLDYRVPYSQGLATFTALQRRGIESRFVYFPDENHWILKPANSLQWHREVLDWLNKHLN